MARCDQELAQRGAASSGRLRGGGRSSSWDLGLFQMAKLSCAILRW